MNTVANKERTLDKDAFLEGRADFHRLITFWHEFPSAVADLRLKAIRLAGFVHEARKY